MSASLHVHSMLATFVCNFIEHILISSVQYDFQVYCLCLFRQRSLWWKCQGGKTRTADRRSTTEQKYSPFTKRYFTLFPVSAWYLSSRMPRKFYNWTALTIFVDFIMEATVAEVAANWFLSKYSRSSVLEIETLLNVIFCLLAHFNYVYRQCAR